MLMAFFDLQGRCLADALRPATPVSRAATPTPSLRFHPTPSLRSTPRHSRRATPTPSLRSTPRHSSRSTPTPSLQSTPRHSLPAPPARRPLRSTPEPRHSRRATPARRPLRSTPEPRHSRPAPPARRSANIVLRRCCALWLSAHSPPDGFYRSRGRILTPSIAAPTRPTSTPPSPPRHPS